VISPFLLISPLAMLSFLFNFSAFLHVFLLCHLLLLLSVSLLSLPSYTPSSLRLHTFSIFIPISIVLHCPSAFSKMFLFFPCFPSCSPFPKFSFSFSSHRRLNCERRVELGGCQHLSQWHHSNGKYCLQGQTLTPTFVHRQHVKE